MPRIEPLYLEPVVGFAMWHIERGEALQDILQRLQADERYGGIDPALLRKGIDRAWQNWIATSKARANTSGLSLADAIGEVTLASEPAGVRVVVTVTFPDGHTEEVSVTVNANSNMTLDEVISHVKLFINNGGLTREGTRDYPVTFQSVIAATVIQGGFGNPAYDITSITP